MIGFIALIATIQSGGETVEIKWRPVVGQQVRYHCSSGLWQEVPSASYVYWQYDLLRTVTVRSIDLSRVTVDLTFQINRSRMDPRMRWESQPFKPIYVSKQVDLRGTDGYSSLPFVGPITPSERDMPGFLYPEGKVSVGDCWERKAKDQSGWKDGWKSTGYAYLGTERKNGRACFKVDFRGTRSYPATPLANGTYWIDCESSEIECLEIYDEKRCTALKVKDSRDGIGYDLGPVEGRMFMNLVRIR